MHNFKDPQNRVWDNASLETCGAGENVIEVMAQTQNQAWIRGKIKLQIIKNYKNQSFRISTDIRYYRIFLAC